MYQGSGKAVWQIRNVASTAGDRFCAWTATARIWTREFEMVKGPMYPRLPWLHMAPSRNPFTIHRIHRQFSWKDLKRPLGEKNGENSCPVDAIWYNRMGTSCIISTRSADQPGRDHDHPMCKEPVLYWNMWRARMVLSGSCRKNPKEIEIAIVVTKEKHTRIL